MGNPLLNELPYPRRNLEPLGRNLGRFFIGHWHCDRLIIQDALIDQRSAVPKGTQELCRVERIPARLGVQPTRECPRPAAGPHQRRHQFDHLRSAERNKVDPRWRQTQGRPIPEGRQLAQDTARADGPEKQ